jgi:hypothetical protein
MMSCVGYDVNFRLVVASLFQGFSRSFTTFHIHPVVVSVYVISEELDKPYESNNLHIKVTGTWILCIRSTIGRRE